LNDILAETFKEVFIFHTTNSKSDKDESKISVFLNDAFIGSHASSLKALFLRALCILWLEFRLFGNTKQEPIASNYQGAYLNNYIDKFLSLGSGTNFIKMYAKKDSDKYWLAMNHLASLLFPSPSL
jgi:hypothetical protein